MKSKTKIFLFIKIFLILFWCSKENEAVTEGKGLPKIIQDNLIYESLQNENIIWPRPKFNEGKKI